MVRENEGNGETERSKDITRSKGMAGEATITRSQDRTGRKESCVVL